MSYKLYVIRDKRSCYQPQVYSFQNDAIACRFAYQMYHEAVDKEPNSPLASFPADFELYCIGSFETDGLLNPFSIPEQVCCFDSFVDFKEV